MLQVLSCISFIPLFIFALSPIPCLHKTTTPLEVYTIKFPGPSVYAKQARGLFCRFLCEQQVKVPHELEDFGTWSSQSSAAAAVGASYHLTNGAGTQTLIFSRSAVPVQKSPKATTSSAKKTAASQETDDKKMSVPAASKPMMTKAAATSSKKRTATANGSKTAATTQTQPARKRRNASK